MDRSNDKLKYHTKAVNTSAIWHAARTTDQLTSPSCNRRALLASSGNLRHRSTVAMRGLQPGILLDPKDLRQVSSRQITTSKDLLTLRDPVGHQRPTRFFFLSKTHSRVNSQTDIIFFFLFSNPRKTKRPSEAK